MIEERKYTEKEIAIFNGLIDLIKNGYNPYTIKVSDIAKSADVGKGTIYDYFDSKEEAISKAILYYMEKEVQASYLRIISKKTFKDKYYELLFIIKDSFENNLSIYNLLFSSGIREFYEHLVDKECSISRFTHMANAVIKDLIDTGVKEGVIIIDKEDLYYLTMAVKGSIAGFSHYMNRKDSYKQISVEKAMDTAFNILLKTLN
ncbi:TetR/AcrR family transcriptional regulator [Wansuia hejianensis]|uniref:TetR/AcrR family transcriptional regulator n=1 Tax=Wansuia hejianensis TaxID=2763667 RepID=A0A926IKZ6_9FIRM|nr:TetR/AcrR family transcriptional regulator [Wansuia hejianensis]MBC8589604.1 TetR/AcrR family transcriptional regulator [Wansuia hejianensis]